MCIWIHTYYVLIYEILFYTNFHLGGDIALNHRAVAVTERVQSKLTGRDFENEELNIEQQVDRLIKQATSPENLCQCYSKFEIMNEKIKFHYYVFDSTIFLIIYCCLVGWCPFW